MRTSSTKNTSKPLICVTACRHHSRPLRTGTTTHLCDCAFGAVANPLSRVPRKQLRLSHTCCNGRHPIRAWRRGRPAEGFGRGRGCRSALPCRDLAGTREPVRHVSKTMRYLSLLLVVALLGTACGSGIASARPDDNPQVLAAAVVELITKNHTFGDGPPPFTDYLIQSSLDPFAGVPTGDGETEVRQLTDDERAAIELAVEPFGLVRWIDDPGDFQTEDLTPTIEGAAIIGVGEPSFDGDEALVPVSLWCGGLCGTWLTYRLTLTDAGWQVAGTEGPIAVS